MMDVDAQISHKPCDADWNAVQRAVLGGWLLEGWSVASQSLGVLDLTPFQNLPLRGGFLLVEARLTARPLLDPIERAATAETLIRGRKFFVSLRADLDERELSISLYHEVLEAATVGSDCPPDPLPDFNEGDFERAARAAHERWGNASASTLNLLLAEFRFLD
jgi:hypothetical protein